MKTFEEGLENPESPEEGEMTNRSGVHVHLGPWRSLRVTFPIRKSEWVCAVVTLGMAIIATLNHSLFEQESYAGMARIADQRTWMWALFLLGAGRLGVLIVNGAHHSTPALRSVAAFISCFAWFQLVVGTSSNLGFGIAVYSGLFWLDFLNARQALQEAGVILGYRDLKRKTLAKPDE